MMGFLADYEPVEDRLAKFWTDHEDGRVVTEMLPAPDGQFVVRAELYRNSEDTAPAATGLAQEEVTAKGVNSKSALENCETSAIGRALANLGYAPKGRRASREEMEKATREPAEQTAWEWLWQESKVFKVWADDARLAKIKDALDVYAYKTVETREQAQTIMDWLKTQSESTEQEALPV